MRDLFRQVQRERGESVGVVGKRVKSSPGACERDTYEEMTFVTAGQVELPSIVERLRRENGSGYPLQERSIVRVTMPVHLISLPVEKSD